MAAKLSEEKETGQKAQSRLRFAILLMTICTFMAVAWPVLEEIHWPPIRLRSGRSMRFTFLTAREAWVAPSLPGYWTHDGIIPIKALSAQWCVFARSGE